MNKWIVLAVIVLFIGVAVAPSITAEIEVKPKELNFGTITNHVELPTEQELMQLIKDNPELQKQYDLITSIKGVGMVTALTMIAAACFWRVGTSQN